MATYYWVGGAGTWNVSSTTNWASVSGGTGGAGVPGVGDNVIFDTSSGTGTVTITSVSAVCLDMTVTATQALTLGGSPAIYGSLTLPSGGSVSVTTFQPTFAATTTGKTINLNGKTIGSTTFNGVGGEWTLSNAFSSTTGTITVTNGSFITANFAVTAQAISSSNSNVRSISLGSSSVTLSGSSPVTFTTATNLTFNAGTSTITCSGNTATFQGGGLTYYNVSFSSTSSVSNTITIAGTNTYNNLTLAPPSSAGYRFYNFNADQTINGTFTTTSSATANRRIVVQTNTAGTQRTLTAAAVSLSYVDFYGIIGAGAASWTGTSIGNGTLNSNITFTSPKTVYWNLSAGGNWVTSTAWATTSGGTPADANFPLPQDTANIVDTGLSTSSTISVGTTGALLSNVNFSTRTLAMTFSFNANCSICGNITWDAQVTSSGTNTVTFYGSTTLVSAGVILTPPISIAAGATLTTSGALTTSNSLTVNGTLSMGSDISVLSASLGSSSTVAFGTNKITLTGNAGSIFSGSSSQTVTGTPVIDCTYSGSTGTRTLNPSTPTESNAISFNITAGTDIVTFGAVPGSIKNVNFTGFSGTLSNNPLTVYGNYTLSTGMSLTAGIEITTFAGTSGPYTITSNGKTLDFFISFNGVGGTWQLADNLLQGSTRSTSLTNGTLDLNGKTYTCGSFATASGTKNLTFNGGTLVVPAVTATAFNNTASTNFTTTAGTGTGKISMTGATAKTFVGGDSTYNCTLEQAGAGALTITGSNTFNNITNTTQPVSVLFTAGTTNTFSNFSLSGTSGNLVTIGSVTSASHTLSKSSGTIDVNYCTISYSTATGGATWNAYTSNGNVNGGNNSGWNFGVTANGLFFGSNF